MVDFSLLIPVVKSDTFVECFVVVSVENPNGEYVLGDPDTGEYVLDIPGSLENSLKDDVFMLLPFVKLGISGEDVIVKISVVKSNVVSDVK